MALQENVLLLGIAVCMTMLKTMMIKTYRSTDYEVHRNWLAITHSLPLEKWYTENTSEWTLDYPPLFAWFEFAISQFAPLFDRDMLKVKNLNYTSDASIMFHRFSVIVADFLYIYASHHFSMACVPKRDKEAQGFLRSPKLITGALLISNFGLFIIDHIHFQYNGFLFGILLLSITAMYQGRYMTSALHFATLLNFKHIFLYIAPAYGIYLLRVYCFSSSKKDGSVIWASFSIRKFCMLATTVLIISGMSFGPFIYMEQFGQVLSRLFPFKRGLCHAYWAPNFWTIYNLMDKALYITGRKFDLVPPSNGSAVMTGGLVQEFQHSVLPSVSPLATFILTALFMIPALIHLWLNPSGPRSFTRSMILCGYTSFMFGWHVHEKAILLVLVPLILLSVDNSKYARHFLLISVTGHISLFPLIFTKFEQPILYFGMAAYTLYTWMSLSGISASSDKPSGGLLRSYEKYYLYLMGPVLFYYAAGHSLVGLDTKLPFLPLLLISAYTSVGITYSYLSLYHTVLRESMIIKIKQR